MKIINIVVNLLILTGVIECVNGRFVEIKKNTQPIYDGNFYEHRCQFEVEVQCFWQKYGRTIATNPYTYIERRDINKAKDCSIRANKSDDAVQFNMRNPVLECTGLANDTERHFQHGESVTLECISANTTNCGWKRNNRSVSIIDRYQYIDNTADSDKVSDCSIRIEDITEHDAGLWECYCKTTDQTLLKSSDIFEFYNVTVANYSGHQPKAMLPIKPKVKESPKTTLKTTIHPLHTAEIITTDPKSIGNVEGSDRSPNVSQYKTVTTKAIVDETSTIAVPNDGVVEKLNGIEIKIVIIILVISVAIAMILVGIAVGVFGKCHKSSKAAETSGISSATSKSASSFSYGCGLRQSGNSVKPSLTNQSRDRPSIPHKSRLSTESDFYIVPIDDPKETPDTPTNGVFHVYEEIPETHFNDHQST